MAENQISKAGHGASTVVSLKTSVDKKRKHDAVSNEGTGDKKRTKVDRDKKTRRGMDKKK